MILEAANSREGKLVRKKPLPRGDYKVGKGRPPLATRWRPGQSGNPKGRPRGAKNLATIFAEALSQKLEIQEKGKFRKISAREGIVLKVVNAALKGDLKAIAFVLAKEPAIAIEQTPEVDISKPRTTEETMKVYQRMIARVVG